MGLPGSRLLLSGVYNFVFYCIHIENQHKCFDEGTDVLMLTTNLIKKDILKGSEWESGLALGGLACFMTPDLGMRYIR